MKLEDKDILYLEDIANSLFIENYMRDDSLADLYMSTSIINYFMAAILLLIERDDLKYEESGFEAVQYFLFNNKLSCIELMDTEYQKSAYEGYLYKVRLQPPRISSIAESVILVKICEILAAPEKFPEVQLLKTLIPKKAH